LNHIGCNPHKEEVRAAIAAQTHAFAVIQKKTDMRCLTLPGERFLFERMMHGMSLAEPGTFVFDCAELDKVRFEEAMNHKLDFCNLALVDFNLLMTHYRPTFDKYGVGIGLEKWTAKDSFYDMVWADYCGAMNNDHLNAIRVMVEKHGKQAFLFYATFSISRLSKQYSQSQYEKMAQSLTKVLAAACKKSNTKFRCIFTAQYGGGEGYHYPMFTIGFSIGRSPAAIPRVDYNFRRTRVDGSGNLQYGSYQKGLMEHRKIMHNGGVNYSLSAKTMTIHGPSKVKSPGKVIRLADYDKASMKDAIEQVALTLRSKYTLDKASIKAYNLAVWEVVCKRFPRATLQNVSATICVRITRRDTFVKAAKKRRAA